MRKGLVLVSALLFGLSMTACSSLKQSIRSEAVGSIRARGNEAFSRGDYPAALRAYRQIAERHPESTQARYDIGRTLMAQEDSIGASEEFMIAHRRNPWVGEYTDALAEALFVSDRGDALFEMLRREASQSGLARDYLRLGRFAARDGAMEEAIDAFEQAALLDGPKVGSAHIELAGLYRTLGETDQEIRELRYVLHAEPANPSAHARLRELDEVPGPSFALEPDED